jgi:TetR/AcrR family transcriptional repressor of bet genes
MTEHQSSDERRAQIVTAMIQTMAEHGYARATIAKIADAAGLTPGLLHYHFKNKQEILLGVLDRLVDHQLQTVRGLIETHDGDPAGALDAILAELLAPGDQARPDQVAAWVAVLAEAVRQPAVAERLTRSLLVFRGLLTEVIQQGGQAGVFDTGSLSAPAAAAGLIALIQGYFAVGVTARDVIPHDTGIVVARQMVAGLTGGHA